MRRGLILAPLAGLLLGAAPDGTPERTHEVRRGETLSHIALYSFGNPALWPAIYEANRDQIKDPARVYPGQRLAIPELDAERREALLREVRARAEAARPASP